MGYKVFISYKHSTMDGKSATRDYTIASELHNALTRAGVKTFFSEKDLSTGDFINEIYDALEESDIMIVVGTKPEHIRSEWVKAEWSTFIAEINGRRKPKGDVYTYLEGMTVNELPSMLYKWQSYTTREKERLVNRIITQLGIKKSFSSDTTSKNLQPLVPKVESKPVSITQPVNQPNPATYTVPKLQPIVYQYPASNYTKPIQSITQPAPQKPLKYMPLIVTVAVVLVVALVSGIWAISNLSGNPTNDSSSGLSDDSTESVKSLSELENLSVGDHFVFGKYKQGAKGDVKLIEWRVLEVQENKALVISEKLLDYLDYNKEITKVTWETCTLRKWLNNDFLNKAFDLDEQAKIATIINDNPDNEIYGVDGGNNTQDKIFALSIEEVGKYFASDTDRIAYTTDYAHTYGYDDGKHSDDWWLRSPGGYRDNKHVAFVDNKGVIDEYGVYPNSKDHVAIRPAFWLNLK